MNKTKVLHLGFHKTGTTFLQEEIFPLLADTLLTRAHHDIWKKCENDTSNVWLHSDESISGSLWSSEDSYIQSFHRRTTNFCSIFEPKKIIVTVRPSEKWLPSLYKQYLHEGGTIAPDSFFDPIDGVIQLNDCLMLQKLQWIEKLGIEMLVLSQEEMRQNESRTIEKIEAFIGTTANNPTSPGTNSVKAPRNVGINTRRQYHFLIRANRLNHFLTSISRHLDLNNRVTRRLKISPRNIAQDWMSTSDSPSVSFDFSFNEKQMKAIRNDWIQLKEQFL